MPRRADGPATPEPALRHAFEAARDPEASPAELAFWRERLAPEGPTLVALCGIGRLLVPLAREGANVQGVDPSASAVALCERRLVAAGRAPLVVREPFGALNLAFRYGAAFVPGGALQRVPDPAEALAGLARVAAHLVPPATLTLELVIPAEARHAPGAPLVEVRSTVDADGTRIVWRSETMVDVEARRIERHSRFERRSGSETLAREDERTTFTWYAEDEVVPLLEAACFASVELLRAPWAGDSDDELRLVVMAQRAG